MKIPIMKYLEEADLLFDYTQELRRDFHKHPELGFKEFRTSEIVAHELGKNGIDKIQTGVAKTGVVALLSGKKPGPVVLIRCDMDALPIKEESVTAYSSQNMGVMHACGHDGHTAVGLTVAKMLSNHKDDLAGTVKFVFQPAEEGMGGADLMVKEGILENPKPDYALAIHVWNEKPIGWLGISPGPIMAAAETFRIKITGIGGHGATPHLTVDPILTASQIVTALQSIVSRNVHPLESSVVTVGSIQGGSAFNIIPPEVILLGTIRTFKPEIRDLVLIRFREIVTGVSKSLGCTVEIEMDPVTPPVINDQRLTKRVQAVASELFPRDEIDEHAITMGSEDFAFMSREIPGCFIFIGSSNSVKGLDAKHHHPKFDFDEAALKKGSALLAAMTVELLSEL